MFVKREGSGWTWWCPWGHYAVDPYGSARSAAEGYTGHRCES